MFGYGHFLAQNIPTTGSPVPTIPDSAPPEWLLFFAMLITFFAIVVCPMVWMLLGHQRKMAGLFHKQGEDQQLASQDRISELTHEVSELRALVHELIIRQDASPVENRLREAPPLPPENILHR